MYRLHNAALEMCHIVSVNVIILRGAIKSPERPRIIRYFNRKMPYRTNLITITLHVPAKIRERAKDRQSEGNNSRFLNVIRVETLPSARMLFQKGSLFKKTNSGDDSVWNGYVLGFGNDMFGGLVVMIRTP